MDKLSQVVIGEDFKVNIAAVLVSHQPSIELLNRNLLALAQQVAHIILVDNGSSNIEDFNYDSLKKNVDSKLDLIKLPTNMGIATGFNVGIKSAQEKGYSYVLLMDQDSIPQSDMVQLLHESFVSLQNAGLQVAATGPRFFDSENQNYSRFVRYGIGGNKQSRCDGTTKAIPADTLISSGTLLSLRAVDQVGLMDETLFIDHVDTEWCLRAKAAGWAVFGVCHALMHHSLGDKRQKIWLLRWRYISFHSPTRFYYMFRNSLLLIRRPYIPLQWKLYCINHLCMLFSYFILLTPNRRLNLRMIVLGVADGMRGIGGKLEKNGY